MSNRLRAVHVLKFIMLVALLLRLLLVADGAQRYFVDEGRYSKHAVVIADSVFNGNVVSGLASLLDYRTHPGAAAVSFVPALIHRVAFELTVTSEISWQYYWKDRIGDFRFSAIFFAIPSVVSISLIYLIARRVGADKEEGLLAAFLLAASNTWFIYSRHLLTYDFSMVCALLALYVSLRSRGIDIRGAILTGLLLFCAFWTYTNHVFLVCTIGILYCIFLVRNPRVLIVNLSFVLIGAAILLIPVLIYNYSVVDIDVFAKMATQAAKITQGKYEEGALLPFFYFRDAEGALCLVWILGIILAMRNVVSRRHSGRHRAILWLTALILLYGLMSLLSTGLHVFVLYGRTVRILVPFISLTCAFAFAPYVKRCGYRLTGLCVAGISVVALMNFLTVISQQHHFEIIRYAREEYGQVSLTTTFSPPSRSYGIPNLVLEGARYELVNAGFYYPITEMTDLPEGEVILKVAHPFNYKPWQYEGFTPEMREIINRDGLYIWLIDKGPAAEE